MATIENSLGLYSIRSEIAVGNFGGFFITQEGIKRGREKEKKRESAGKEEGRECVKKKKREGKERERRKEIGIQVPARPIDGPMARVHACFFEDVPLARMLGSAQVPARNANRAAAGRQWRSGSIRS